jgi:hypothetical protein
MTRTPRFLIAILLLTLPCFAQNPAGPQPPVSTPSLTLTLADPPQPVGAASVTLLGNPGHGTQYYWIVTNSLIGSSTPAGPFVLKQAPDTYGAGAGAVINWSPVPGALTYDLLRTSTSAQPNGTFVTCAVVTGLTGTSFNDTFSSLSGYWVNPVTSSSFNITLQNKSSGAGSSALLIGNTTLGGVAIPTPGIALTLTAPNGVAICTGACTVTVPVPAAGYQFCVVADDNVSAVITLSALGYSARYENTARTGYGTASSGSLSSTAAVGNMVCIVGRDSTHYLTTNYVGTWTAN